MEPMSADSMMERLPSHSHIIDFDAMMEPLPSLSDISESVASVNVANFVPTKLQWLPGGVGDNNYETWKAQMCCLMESQGLSEYVDGSITLPLGRNQDYGVWKRNDALVRGWIVGSLSDQIVSTVVAAKGLNSARQVWAHLEHEFGPTPTITPRDENWRKLHMTIVGREKAIGVGLETLLEKLDPADLVFLRDADNSTALHIAASVGNQAAASYLVKKNPNLCYIQNKYGHFPIHVAALYMQREVLDYLITCTESNGESYPYCGNEGQQLLTCLIKAEYFGLAVRLSEKYPGILEITALHDDTDSSSLRHLTIKMKRLSTKNFNFMESCIYSWIVSLETTLRPHSGRNRNDDIEGAHANSGNDSDTSHKFSGLWLNFLRRLLKCIKCIVPQKTMLKITAANEAQPLLKALCEQIRSRDFNTGVRIFHEAIFVAAESGVPVVVKAIIKEFPDFIYSLATPSGQHVLRRVIEYRCGDVFKLIMDEISCPESFFTSYFEDNDGNNLLHLAGKLAPPHKLNKTSGAALQMQHEIQWFEAVKDIIHPYSTEQKNSDGKTPKMVFTEEHALLKEAGEKWMKETANSFTFVAALIATVMFTGAITVPGGNEGSSGMPVFSREPAFIVFAISDAASLFASATSLLQFLAILTSRYAQKDFWYSLPSKIMIGLGFLVLSVLSMLVSFIATVYLVFGQKRLWVLCPLLILAWVPAVSFVQYQFPLLRDLYSSTCGGGIFGRRPKRGLLYQY